MIQNRLKDKEKDIQGLKKQTSSLLNCAWEKGYVAGFDDGYKTGRQSEERPTGEWIPVSERLPKEKINPYTTDFDEVLCTTDWGEVIALKFGTPILHHKPHFWLGGAIMDEHIIAWQYKPEPYKKGDEK